MAIAAVARVAAGFGRLRALGWRGLAPTAAVALVAAFVAWAFAAMVLTHTPSMGLPLDDSYIYLTYAKQAGRLHPFTYFPGGGYSAGATSALWPLVLAPFWSAGARGHALVWVSYGLCGVLYALVGLGVARFVRRTTACPIVGAACGVMALAVPAFAFCALSGMEVAFAAALLVATLLLLLDVTPGAPPRKLLILTLAATSLSRPEATALVVAITFVGAVRCLWLGTPRRLALRWLLPLSAPVLWMIANRVFAGHFFPNTGIVKSHFYLPGFDWTYYRTAVLAQAGALLKGLFWAPTSPLVVPRLVLGALVLGAVRAVLWARREQKWLVAIVALGAPFALMLAVIATSASGWDFQNYRYVATALPLLFIVVGFALAPPRVGLPFVPWPRWPFCAAGAALAVAYCATTRPLMRANMLLYAQGAADTNSQVVALGNYIHDKLPGARVMLHDAGAIAYYGDGDVYDMLGLVTNGQADVANNGPGARFEFLEHLPPERRPTHFAYYPAWLGLADFFGDPVLRTPLGPQFTNTLASRRLAGDYDMQLLPAVWDHVGTGEAPLNDHAGWTVVDRVDVADLDSERAHGWSATLGRRHLGDHTALWSFVDREVMQLGLVIDGGRTIRRAGDGGPDAPIGEAFDIEVDPTKPTRLVLRTGGAVDLPLQERITHSTNVALWVDGKAVGRLDLAPPAGGFAELTFNLPPREKPARGGAPTPPRRLHVTTVANGLYRAFHWFALQPL